MKKNLDALIANRSQLKHHVGEYFVRLAHYLLASHNPKFERLVQNDKNGDLLHFGLQALLEIKADDNHHSWLIYERQMEHHIEEINQGFPVSRGFYILFGYKNGSGDGMQENNRRPLMRQSKDRRRLEKFLAANVTVMYIVDARLFPYIRNIRGTRTESWKDGSSRTYIPVSRTILNTIARDVRGTFQKMGAEELIPEFVPGKRNSISDIPIKVRFRQRTIERINVVPLVPLSSQRKLKRYLNGTVVS